MALPTGFPDAEFVRAGAWLAIISMKLISSFVHGPVLALASGCREQGVAGLQHRIASAVRYNMIDVRYHHTAVRAVTHDLALRQQKGSVNKQCASRAIL